MQLLELTTKGMLIGFSIAAPVGPIGVLCIRRSLDRGMLAGLVTGLGAAVADALYGAIAGFGLAAVSHSLLAGSRVLSGVGGAYLIFLAVKTFRSQPQRPATTSAEHVRLIPSFVSAVFLTLTNPMTILFFVAIFAGMRPRAASDLGAGWFILGVFLGSAVWWIFLSGFVSAVRSYLSRVFLRSINLLSGTVLGIFGVLAIWRSIAA